MMNITALNVTYRNGFKGNKRTRVTDRDIDIIITPSRICKVQLVGLAAVGDNRCTKGRRSMFFILSKECQGLFNMIISKKINTDDKESVHLTIYKSIWDDLDRCLRALEANRILDICAIQRVAIGEAIISAGVRTERGRRTCSILKRHVMIYLTRLHL